MFFNICIIIFNMLWALIIKPFSTPSQNFTSSMAPSASIIMNYFSDSHISIFAIHFFSFDLYNASNFSFIATSFSCDSIFNQPCINTTTSRLLFIIFSFSFYFSSISIVSNRSFFCFITSFLPRISFMLIFFFSISMTTLLRSQHCKHSL